MILLSTYNLSPENVSIEFMTKLKLTLFTYYINLQVRTVYKEIYYILLNIRVDIWDEVLIICRQSFDFLQQLKLFCNNFWYSTKIFSYSTRAFSIILRKAFGCRKPFDSCRYAFNVPQESYRCSTGKRNLTIRPISWREAVIKLVY